MPKKKVEEKEVKVQGAKALQVLLPNGLPMQVFSLELHGKEFLKLANESVAKRNKLKPLTQKGKYTIKKIA